MDLGFMYMDTWDQRNGGTWVYASICVNTLMCTNIQPWMQTVCIPAHVRTYARTYAHIQPLIVPRWGNTFEGYIVWP